MNWKRCPRCTRDPDPRGPSACYDCREINTRREMPVQATTRLGELFRAVEDHHVALRFGEAHDAALTKRALDGAVEAYLRPEGPDFSEEHIHRVAGRLFRGCEWRENWRALAHEAIQLGAVVRADETGEVV